MMRTCTRSLALIAVVVAAIMTSPSEVKAAYNCASSFAVTGPLQGTFQASANLTDNGECFAMAVSFGDTYDVDFYSEVCGNAGDAVTRAVSHTYASADSYYCHISAGRIIHYGNWDVFEQCTSAEGFITVH